MKRILAGMMVMSFVLMATVGAEAALLVSGDVIGVDFGGTVSPVNNFNEMVGNATIAAGSVKRNSDAVLLDGVSITVAGTAFNGDDSAAHGGEDVVFDDSNLTDWVGDSGDDTFTITFSGLDDSLLYTVLIGAGFSVNQGSVYSTQDGKTTGPISNTSANPFGTINKASTDGSGNLIITATQTAGTAAVVSAMTLTVGLPLPAIQAGDVIAVDFASAGGSAANYNVFSATGTVAVDSVINYTNGVAIEGVSLELTSSAPTMGFVDDGNANNWPGTTADPYYVAAADDIMYVGAGNIKLRFAGLDNSRGYNLRVYSLITTTPWASCTFTVTDGNSLSGSRQVTNTRTHRWTAATLEDGNTVFSGLATDGSGVIELVVGPASVFMNAVVLEVVDAPAPPTPTQAIQAGDVIGVDFGGTVPPVNNFNEMVGNATIAAGHVKLNSGVAFLDGVSITVAGTTFKNDDSAAHGGEDAVFDDSNLTDWVGVAGTFTITFSGLDDSLFYTVLIGAGFSPNQGSVYTTQDSKTTGAIDNTSANPFGTITKASTDGSGNLIITATATGAAVASAMTLTAEAPEGTVILLR